MRITFGKVMNKKYRWSFLWLTGYTWKKNALFTDVAETSFVSINTCANEITTTSSSATFQPSLIAV